MRAANAEEVAAREEIEAIIRTRTRDEWYDYLVKADVCVGKVYEPEEMVADPQVQARDMIVELRHPTARHHQAVRRAHQALRDAGDDPVRLAAPHSGEHTDEVLRGLGLSAEEIRGLRASRVVA